MNSIADYDHDTGLVLELADNTDVAALVDYLGIPKSRIGMVSVNEQPVKADYKLPDNAMVKLFQPIFGG